VAEGVSKIIGDLGSDAACRLWRRRWWRRCFVRVNPDALTHADANAAPYIDPVSHTDPAAQHGR
jgi:hypothetical protein